jgi:hypothetical protein
LKVSSFSEEKEAKRLLFIGHRAIADAGAQGPKVLWFFLSRKNTTFLP